MLFNHPSVGFLKMNKKIFAIVGPLITGGLGIAAVSTVTQAAAHTALSQN